MNPSTRAVLFTFLIGIASLSCADVGQCNVDSDCMTGRACQSAFCVDLAWTTGSASGGTSCSCTCLCSQGSVHVDSTCPAGNAHCGSCSSVCQEHCTSSSSGYISSSGSCS